FIKKKNTTEYEYSVFETVSEKSNWDKVSATRNNRGIQKELSTLSHESDNTNNSDSVFDIPLSKSSSICELDNTYKNSKNKVTESLESFEDEVIVLNNSLKNNIINSSFETTNKSDIFNYNLLQPTFVQFGQNLSVNQIEYFLEFQEYSKTLPTGVASIYNVFEWDSNKAKQVFEIANIQYSYGNPRNMQQIQKYLFLESIKICEFSLPELNIEYTFVDFENQLYKKIFDVNESSAYTDQDKVINKCFTVLPNSSITNYYCK
ncbi:33030_t:CDS:2, partial [Racocetra persica]